MARQVYDETSTWQTRRAALSAQLKTAMMSGDFSQCPTNQYGAQDQGQFGFPVTTDIEQVILVGYAQAGQTPFAGADAIGAFMQVNTLESFRRAYLSWKQVRRDLVAHAVQALGQTAAYDDLMLQQFVSIDKNLPQA
jgi:hypothetical protein